MAKIIVDNLAYAKTIKLMGQFAFASLINIDNNISSGFRTNAAATDFSAILPEDLEATVKAAAEISMGTEISDSDIAHINSLCEQVISITAYRTQLAEYLRNRMNAIAPNLTALVGELVGARLISHAGSLLNLAKHPASTIQILGAEKALFRALKTKHDTPKYGIIYHVSVKETFFLLRSTHVCRRPSSAKHHQNSRERYAQLCSVVFAHLLIGLCILDGSYDSDKGCSFHPCRRSHRCGRQI